MNNKVPSYENVLEIRKLFADIGFQHWYHDDVFTLGWWFLLISATLPWYIWWKLVDKKRIFEIFSYGLVWGIFSVLFDVVGADFILWGYPDKLLPNIPPLLPADLTVIPVSYMLAYQYCSSWKAFSIVNVLLAALFSYVIEPIFKLFNFIELHKWNHTYSFIGFIICTIAIKVLIDKLKNTKEVWSS